MLFGDGNRADIEWDMESLSLKLAAEGVTISISESISVIDGLLVNSSLGSGYK